MSTTPKPVQSQDSREAALHLFAALRMAAFVPLPDGRFRLLGASADSLRELLPDTATVSDLDLIDRFPLIESFLPEAEQVWRGMADARLGSDMWAETLPSGDETHLQAWAVQVANSSYLVIEAADALHHERQLVVQY